MTGDWTMTVYTVTGEETPDLCGNEDEMWSHAIKHAKRDGVLYVQLWERDSYPIVDSTDDVFRVYTEAGLLDIMKLPRYDPYDIVEVDEDNGIAYVDWYTEAPGVELTAVPLDHCEYDEHLGWKLRDEYVCEIPDDAEVSEYTEEETVVVV